MNVLRTWKNFSSHEYKQIHSRRNISDTEISFVKPKKLIGLALSGGGIRSAAFQLGLLSGLNKGSYQRKPLLKRID